MTGDKEGESPHGYICKVAGKGWKETSKTEEYYGLAYPVLDDINECEASDAELADLGLSGNLCSEVQDCENTLGSYKCVCKNGFTTDDFGNCVDIDECKDVGACDGKPNTECHNNDGSFSCDCKLGYSTGFGDQSGNTKSFQVNNFQQTIMKINFFVNFFHLRGCQRM